MPDGFDFARYQDYLTVAARDLGMMPCRSLREARSRWGIRCLSASQFQDLADAAAKDPSLCRRWRERLTLGYYAEKRRLENEIEEAFAGIPIDESISGGYEDAA